MSKPPVEEMASIYIKIPKAVRQVARIRSAEEDKTLAKYIHDLIVADAKRSRGASSSAKEAD